MAVPLVQLTRSAPTAGPLRPSPPPARKPGVAQGEGPGRAQLRAPQEPDARARAPHGVRGGALPQRRRVLGAQGRHVHDPGRRLHPELRLLRRRPRHARRRSTRWSRCAWPRRSSAMGLRARGDHLGRPRRPARRRRLGLRRLHHRDHGAGCPRPRSRCSSPTSRARSGRSASCSRRGPTSTTTTSRPPSGSTSWPAPAAGTSARCELLAQRPAHGARRARPRPASSSAWARSGTRSLVVHAGPPRGATSTSSRSASTSARPTSHLPVARYYTPDEFAELREIGLAMGFRTCSRARSPGRRYHAWEQVARRRRRSAAR